MSRARRQFTEGLMSDNPWRMGFGVALGLVGFLRKARRPQPEVVQVVALRPGQSLRISVREPRAGEKQPRAGRARRRRRR